MIYVLYGKDLYLRKKELEKIMKEHQIEEIDCSQYDLILTPLKDVVEDASTISLFHSEKMIIAENALFLSGVTKKNGIEQNVDDLSLYLDHLNPDCHLVLIVDSDKLDERKKIVKKIKQVGVVKECSQPKDIQKFVSAMAEDYQIDYQARQLLIERTKGDLLLLEKELEKLKMYRYDEKKISLEDVENYTTKTVDMDIFHFIENIVANKKEAALATYDEMLKNNEEPIKIIIMLANQFRLIFQAKKLYKKGYTEKDIATALGIHPYRIKLALQNGRNFECDQLLSYLNRLALLDSKIKHGEIEKKFALERFILEL